MRKNTTKNGLESLYQNIIRIIEEGKNSAFRAVNFAMVKTYWTIGKLIIEDEQNGKKRADYGKEILKDLANKLTLSYGKGFDESNLRHMRNFYALNKKQDAVRPELSWTHYRMLLKVERKDARTFYIRESIEGNWSTRTLERQINSLYFERMVMSDKKGKTLVKKEAENKKEILQAKDIIKDPYVLEFLDLKHKPNFYEKELEQALIDKMQEFLLELGNGFSFVKRQQRITTDGEHFFIDLVFYNYILKCFLLIDLKTGKLTHQDIGQMDMYVRYYEEEIKQENDNPTIGLILCAEKNNAMAKYSLLKDSKQIFASKYKVYLPSEKQLQREIKRERELVETEKRLKLRSDKK